MQDEGFCPHNRVLWKFPHVKSTALSFCKDPKLLGLSFLGMSSVAQLVKNPPAVQETWVRSLGWKDPLEKGMATHSSILAWRIPWTIPWGHKESDTIE